MLDSNTDMATLLSAPMRAGKVVWIGLRPGRREPVLAVASVVAEAAKGLSGDRYRTRNDGKRQVTLIQAEHLVAIASHLGLEAVAPEQLRRNIVVSGINLLALKHERFRIGGAVLEYSGQCHPCSRMEETFGSGGYNAVRGHGGITARILETGQIRLDDPVVVLQPERQRD